MLGRYLDTLTDLGLRQDMARVPAEIGRSAFSRWGMMPKPGVSGAIFLRTATQPEWITHVLINLDFPAHIVRPDEQRNLLGQMADKALQIAGEAQ